MKKAEKVMNANEIKNCISEIARKVSKEFKGNINDFVIIGIRTRGVYLAQRIAEEVSKLAKKEIPLGILDITLYRDDVDDIRHQPLAKETRIPFDLTGKYVLLVDDVLFTGRSIRAAIDEIIDFGRPKRIALAVLIDRNHRELPIQPDYVGKKVETKLNEKIDVKLKEIDNVDCVLKVKG